MTVTRWGNMKQTTPGTWINIDISRDGKIISLAIEDWEYAKSLSPDVFGQRLQLIIEEAADFMAKSDPSGSLIPVTQAETEDDGA